MKTLLLILFNCSVCLSAPVVEIVNLDTVRIDGVIHGDVVTATLANSKLAPDIQAALAAFFKTPLDAVAAAQSAQAAAETKLAAITAKLADPSATKDDAKAEADKTEKERQLLELAKQAADIQAKIEALNAQAGTAALKAAKPAVPGSVKSTLTTTPAKVVKPK